MAIFHEHIPAAILPDPEDIKLFTFDESWINFFKKLQVERQIQTDPSHVYNNCRRTGGCYKVWLVEDIHDELISTDHAPESFDWIWLSVRGKPGLEIKTTEDLWECIKELATNSDPDYKAGRDSWQRRAFSFEKVRGIINISGPGYHCESINTIDQYTVDTVLNLIEPNRFHTHYMRHVEQIIPETPVFLTLDECQAHLKKFEKDYPATAQPVIVPLYQKHSLISLLNFIDMTDFDELRERLYPTTQTVMPDKKPVRTRKKGPAEA